VCRALEKRADSRAEETLVELLVRSGGGDALKAQAVKALATSGTAKSVEPLQTLAKAADGELKVAAREAVRQIQSRLVGVEAGRLSVVDSGAEGALSIANTAGELSLPDKVKS
jgi:hypothetical protein